MNDFSILNNTFLQLSNLVNLENLIIGDWEFSISTLEQVLRKLTNLHFLLDHTGSDRKDLVELLNTSTISPSLKSLLMNIKFYDSSRLNTFNKFNLESKPNRDKFWDDHMEISSGSSDYDYDSQEVYYWDDGL